MLISPSKKIAFIHIQKTAGSTIETILRDQFDDLVKIGGRHNSVRAGVESLSDWAQYFSFAFVRNPWDRLVSWYAMIEEAGKIKWIDKFRSERHRNRYKKARAIAIWKYVLGKTNSFDDFIHLLADNRNLCDPNAPITLGWDQIDYLADRAGNITVDFIGRFENFQMDFQIICSRMGIDMQKIKQLNRITNKSRHQHYSAYYTAKTRAIVESLYHRDISYFKYKFEHILNK